MELEIDAKELLRLALAEVQPGEDIDEAILRACKNRFPDNYSEIFPDVFQMVEMLAENMAGSRLDVIRELANSEGSMSITLHSAEVTETRTFTGEPKKLLDELPPEMQAKFFDCRCGFLGLGEFDVCPKCGRKAQ